MDVHISLKGRGELTSRIYRQLLEAMLDGRLRPGERLPPTRDLARQLAVSRNTVAVAYERLVAEGFLDGRVGAGTFVADARLARDAPRQAPEGGSVRPRRIWQALRPRLDVSADPAPYNFRVGTPDPSLFPLAEWRRLVRLSLRPAEMATSGYGAPAGHEGLRHAIARHVGLSRAVRAGAEDVIVTQGAQQALDLIGRVLIEPGCTVAVEEPGYPPARLLFRSLGARVAPVAVDEEGLVVRAIPASARLVYVTPSHQFPLGVPLSLARRGELLAWAERRRAVIVEDDYDSEYRFSGRPLDPIQSLDRTGRVVYVGSFSKVMLPTLRLGFLVAPASLRRALRTAKQLSDWRGEGPTQAALARFIDEGLLARHIRRASRVYAARRQRIIDGIATDFADVLRLMPSVAGLHVTARVTGHRVAIDEAIRRAQELGVSAESLSRYCYRSRAWRGLVLGYGTIEADGVDEGLRRLRRCFEA